MNKITEIYSRVLVRLENAVLRYPKTLLLLLLLVCGLSLFYTVRHLSIDTDTTRILSEDLPFQQDRKRFIETFPQDDQAILVVVDGKTPEQTIEALNYLESRFRSEKQRIQSFYIPGSGEFFDRHGLLYLDLDELEELAAGLTKAQPFIGTLSRDNSLKSLLDVIALAITEKEQELPVDLKPLLDKIRMAVGAALDGKTYPVSWQQMMIGEDRDFLNAQRFILVKPTLNFDEMTPAEESLAAVRAIVDKAEQDLPGVNIRLTGEVVLEHEELATVTYSAEMASIASLVLVCMTLITGYRSIRLMLITLTVIVMGLILTAGFATLAIGHLNILSVSFATLYIGIGDDYAVQMCLRYRELLAQNLSRQQALVGAVRNVGPSITLCAIAGATGFFAFVPTAYTGVSELGIISGVGIFISLLITLIALPALLRLFPLELAPAEKSDSLFPDWVYRFPMRHATLVKWMAAALTVGGLALLTQARFDSNPINLRDPDTESVTTFKELLKNKDSSPMTLTVLAKNNHEALSMARKLEQLKSVKNAITIFDYVPDNQEAKLSVIEELSLVMGMQLTTFPPVRQSSNEANIEALEKLEQAIDRHLTQKPDDELSLSLRSLREDLARFSAALRSASDAEQKAKLDKLQFSLLDTLPDTMNMLLKGLKADFVTVDSLPRDLSERWLGKDGTYRIMVLPNKDLNKQQNLNDFVAEVRQLAPGATDLPVIYLESGKAIVGAFKQALVSALVAIVVILLISRRSIKDTLVILIPLLMTGILTGASTVVMDNPFNFANIIVIPLLFGLGVDAGIFIVDRLRNPDREDSVLDTSTARGVVFGEMTTLCSMVSMTFTPHPGLASMGLLLAIGLILMVICTLGVLPAFAGNFKHKLSRH
jgi:hopanoid biosynthesis associated RND transporter like protein HpnN